MVIALFFKKRKKKGFGKCAIGRVRSSRISSTTTLVPFQPFKKSVAIMRNRGISPIARLEETNRSASVDIHCSNIEIIRNDE